MVTIQVPSVKSGMLHLKACRAICLAYKKILSLLGFEGKTTFSPARKN